MNTWTEGHMSVTFRQQGVGRRRARVVATLAVAATTFLAAARAEARSDTTMDPNSVLDVDAFDGPQFQQPADGRIRGYDFSVTVTEAGPVARAERVLVWLTPNSGQRLVGFKLRFDRTPGDVTYDIRGALLVDGSRIPLSDSLLTVRTGEHAFVASVPADAQDLQLELSAAGLAQTFSLTTMARSGTQPAALYRDPISPEVVRDDAGQRTLRLTRIGTKDRGSVVIRLDKARLSFFTPPDPVQPASDAGRAFLIVEGSTRASFRGTGFEAAQSLGGTAVTATLPDGSTLEAVRAGPESEGLLSGAYYFEVPADIEAVRVTVRPDTFEAWRTGEIGAVPARVRTEGAAAFDIEFTPGGAAKLPPPPKDAVLTPEAPGLSDPSNGEGASGRRPAPALLVLVLVFLVASAGLYLRRRRTPAERRRPKPAAAAAHAADEAGEPKPAADMHGQALTALREAIDNEQTEVVVLDRGAATKIADQAYSERVRYVPYEAALAREIEAAHLAAAQAAASAAEDGLNGGRHRVFVLMPGPAGEDVVDLTRKLASGNVDVQLCVVDSPAAAVPEAGGGRAAEPSATVAPPEVATAGSNGHGAGVAVELLGPYRISVDGAVVGSGLRKKARELLALLALRPEGVTAEAAIDALWPSSGPEKSADFRQALTNLRSVLRADGDPVVVRVGARYQLVRAKVALDVAAFEEAVQAARGTPGAAERAAEVYRGELAEGEDYPWAEADRERLRRAVLDSLAHSVEQCRSAGDLAGAAAALERAVGIERYSDPLYCELMVVYRRQGREDAVRRTYERLRAALHEIDATPDPRTTALVRETTAHF